MLSAGSDTFRFTADGVYCPESNTTHDRGMEPTILYKSEVFFGRFMAALTSEEAPQDDSTPVAFDCIMHQAEHSDEDDE